MGAWQRAGYPLESGIDRLERLVRLSYGVTLDAIPENAKRVNLWIPIPRSNSIQSIKQIQISDGVPYDTLIDNEYNNRFLHFELSEEQIKSSNVILTAFFQVRRKDFRKNGSNNNANLGTDAALERYLNPDNPVPVNVKISQKVISVAHDIKEPSQQAKLLFNYIVDEVKHDGNASEKGSDIDFYSLFIKEARSLGIPARLVMGFELSPESKIDVIEGYHCWSEVYIDEEGWIPVDISEAKKYTGKKWKYFGNLDANRVAFTIGQNIRIPGAESNPVKSYIIYPYAEADGKEIPIKWRMNFREL